MRIFRTENVLLTWTVSCMRSPGLSTTFVLKESFRLQLAPSSTPFSEPGFSSQDRRLQVDLNQTEFDPTDVAPHKPSSDLLLSATCHPPGGKPATACRVAFLVGRWSKELIAVGDRVWKGGVPTIAAPFTQMPIRYENSFGGPGYALNPAGTGFNDGRLPNVEIPGALITSPDHRPTPAGFGPIAPDSPARMKKAGTYDKKWLKERWPWYPEDFDWSYFNAAPEDQQLPGYLRGDEELMFENLHPEHSIYKTRLPGMRARCMVVDRVDGAERLREVPLVLDTLWVDMDAEKLVLVWRGNVEVRSLDLLDIERVYATTEPLAQTPQSKEALVRQLDEEYEAQWRDEPAPPSPAPEPEETSVDEEIAKMEAEIAKLEAQAEAHLADAKKQLAASGVDPAILDAPAKGPTDFKTAWKEVRPMIEQSLESLRQHAPEKAAELEKSGLLQCPDVEFEMPEIEPEPEPWTRERVAASSDLSGQDLSKLDLSGLDLSKRRFDGARLNGAKLAKANLSGTSLPAASLSEADLSGADLTGCAATGADFSHASLEGAKLAGATLQESDFEEANLTGADLSGAQGKWTSFAGANLVKAQLKGAEFPSADFSKANLEGADLTDAKLPSASFEGAKAAKTIWDGADLTKLAASEGADFAGARFRKVKGAESYWEGAKLDDADFSESSLERADFSRASLARTRFFRAEMTGARFSDAILHSASLAGANLCQGSFERADLAGSDLTGANCYEAEFWDAKLENTQQAGSNLARTKLA